MATAQPGIPPRFRLARHLLAEDEKEADMKILITIVPETGRVSPMFDAAAHAAVLCLRHGEVIRESEIELPPGVGAKIELLRAVGAALLITGAISDQDVTAVRDLGIAVCPFVSGIWREVWGEWHRAGRLADCYVMPGCCAHHRRCCRNRPSADREKAGDDMFNSGCNR
ncbi:MAG: NifB/NifX family molybdenum-iron cluster-binding protein [Victivallaceae bacterium]